jgi:hypothetical protein
MVRNQQIYGKKINFANHFTIRIVKQKFDLIIFLSAFT